jgi:hypothetical protein
MIARLYHCYRVAGAIAVVFMMVYALVRLASRIA